MADGIASAVAGREGLLPIQQALIEAMFPAMTGHRVTVADRPPMKAAELATALARRDLPFRTRGVQLMLLCALVRHPLPEDVAENVAEFACELGVEEGMVRVAREFAAGSLGLAAYDFTRNGYEGTWHEEESAAALHSSPGPPRAVGALGQRPRAGGALGRARDAARGHHRAQGVGDVPGPRVHLPGYAGVRASPPRTARLGARAGGLRLDRGIGGRGVRPDRPRQRRHARVLAPGHGDRPVRDGLSRPGRGAVRVVAGTLLVEPGNGGAARRRHGQGCPLPRRGDRRRQHRLPPDGLVRGGPPRL